VSNDTIKRDWRLAKLRLAAQHEITDARITTP
jgi:hypothetical protein